MCSGTTAAAWVLVSLAAIRAGGWVCRAGEAEEVRFGLGTAPPMVYQGDAGRARGFAVDAIEEAARREGVRPRWVLLGAKSPDDALRDGTIDVLPVGIVTAQRLREFVVTKPWWESATEALVLNDGPIRKIEELRGRRIAANKAGAAVALALAPGEVVAGGSATEMAALVCAGRADGAVVAGMFLRQLLADKPEACRGVGLRLLDLGRPIEYALVARGSKASLAWRLRARLDEITLDGSLARIAGAHPDISAPLARRATELLRAQYDERVARQRLVGLGALLVMLLWFTAWTMRSRARLRAANIQLKATMEALQSSEQRWRAMVEMGSDWIWEVNLKGEYTFSSPIVKDLLGYEPEEVIGRLPTDFMPPEEGPRLRAMLREVTASPRRAIHLESVRIRKNGSRMVMETSAMPIHDAAGVLAGFRGASRDVTLRKRREREVAAQAGVNRALAEGADLDSRLSGVLNAMQGLEAFEFGAAWRLDESRNSASCVASWSRSESGGSPLANAARRAGAAHDPLLWRVIDGRELICEPVAELAGDGELAAAARLAAHGGVIGLPMQAGNALNGAILLFRRDSETPEPQILEALLAIGRRVGEAMERYKAEEQVRRFVADSPTVLYALRVLPDRLTATFVSSNVEQLTGFAPAEAIAPGWWLNGIHPDDRERVLARNPMPYEIDRQTLEYRFRKKDGSYIWVLDEKRLLRSERGEASEVVGAMSDVTKRVELEQQLRHAQKMEAIGSLAAGVAHDFNNLLTVINGFSELLLREQSFRNAAEGRVRQILQAGEKAAALTRQLLALSRKQKVEKRVFEVQRGVSEMEEMLRRLIGEDIELVISNAAHGRVLADAGQFEQVVLNLVVNARDAMPEGGRLEVQTADLKLSAPRGELAAGDYVELKVSDTGSGMDAEVVNRIFEPFFTTKAPGQGTGLGLATVYGIVKQMGGSVEVESEPGRGSTFRITAPCCGEKEAAAAADPGERGRRQEGTILLVEDEPAVRRVTAELLRACGYSVVEAESAEEALELAATPRGDDWRLLLTDVVMPKMNGFELAERILKIRPHLKVLLMSGYPERGGAGAGMLTEGGAFLQKPFPPGELVRRVGSLLGEAQADANLLS